MVSKLHQLDENQRLFRFRVSLIRWLFAVVAALLFCWSLSPYIKIGFNTNHSVAGYVFLIVKNQVPAKGKLVAFWPPKNDFYNDIWFVKYVQGEPGDLVERRGQDFYINGIYVSTAKTTSLKGVTLKASESGEIQSGYYFVGTGHKDGFDSRYEQIGLISKNSFIGSAYRLL